MLKSMGKSKKCIFWMVTFGLMGLTGVLLAPVVMYIIKVSKRYPKAFGWITTAAFVVICILYIYGFLYRQVWNVSFVPICICMVMAIGRVLNNNIR